MRQATGEPSGSPVSPSDPPRTRDGNGGAAGSSSGGQSLRAPDRGAEPSASFLRSPSASGDGRSATLASALRATRGCSTSMTSRRTVSRTRSYRDPGWWGASRHQGGDELAEEGCFAVVRGNGSLDRGSSVLSSKRLGAGRYRVEFQGRVDACALATTIGNGGKFTAPTGSVTAGRAALPLVTTVNVATFDVQGRAADRTFHLVVTC